VCVGGGGGRKAGGRKAEGGRKRGYANSLLRIKLYMKIQLLSLPSTVKILYYLFLIQAS
jgi:hypothetical protein